MVGSAIIYRVLVVGRQSRDPLLEAVDDYARRLGRYVRAEVVRLREGTPATERDLILGHVQPAEHVIALDERGVELTTVELARKLSQLQQRGLRRFVFVVGGADGLHADVKARANELLSLSRFTLPHRLAQVVLLEQLYRAHTVLRGEPYHRA